MTKDFGLAMYGRLGFSVPLVNSHDRVVALQTDEARFLAIVRAAMVVVAHAVRQ